MAKGKATPRVPPKGWERPLDSAPAQEIQWYNDFVKEWKERGKSQFPGDEEAWKKIVPKLKITGPSTRLIYNHSLGKVADDELVWGHLVAALIMFGVDKVKGSVFGRRVQTRYPTSDITRLVYNNDGPTISDTTTKPRQRGNSASQDEEDLTDEVIDEAFESITFDPVTSSTTANKSVTSSNLSKTGAHSSSTQGPTPSLIPKSTGTAFTPINPEGQGHTTSLTLQKETTPDQPATIASEYLRDERRLADISPSPASSQQSFNSSQSLTNQRENTRANNYTFPRTFGSGKDTSKQPNLNELWGQIHRGTDYSQKPGTLSNTDTNNAFASTSNLFATRRNLFPRAGSNESITPRPNAFSPETPNQPNAPKPSVSSSVGANEFVTPRSNPFTSTSNSFVTKHNLFPRAGSNESATPRPNAFSSAKADKRVTFAPSPHQPSPPAANSDVDNIQPAQLAKLPGQDTSSLSTEDGLTTAAPNSDVENIQPVQLAKLPGQDTSSIATEDGSTTAAPNSDEAGLLREVQKSSKRKFGSMSIDVLRPISKPVSIMD